MFTSFSARLKNHSGLILIELMLAVALGLLLMSGLLEIMLSSKRSERLQAALHAIQENAQTAMGGLRADIQAAGYIGCPRLGNDFHVHAYPPYSITAENKLTGKDENEITVKHAGFQSVLLKKMTQDRLTLYTGTEVHFASGDILIISDCQQAEIFQAAKININQGKQKIVAAHALRQTFLPDAEISRLETNRYFIAETNRKDNYGNPVYALFVEQNNGRKTEWVEGIQAMCIRFSVNSDGSLIDLPASQIHDWSSVAGVAIDMEVASPPLKKIWHLYVALR